VIISFRTFGDESLSIYKTSFALFFMPGLSGVAVSMKVALIGQGFDMGTFHAEKHYLRGLH
jgi:hypothetical protein